MTQITFYKIIFIFCMFFSNYSCTISFLESKYSIASKNETLNNIKSYYDNGSIEYEAEMIDGLPHGKTSYFYKNNIIKSVAYYTNGQLNGNNKGFYENGNIKYNIQYVFGKKNGYERWYYSNENIKLEKKYNNDKIIGKIIRWDIKGNIIY